MTAPKVAVPGQKTGMCWSAGRRRAEPCSRGGPAGRGNTGAHAEPCSQWSCGSRGGWAQEICSPNPPSRARIPSPVPLHQLNGPVATSVPAFGKPSRSLFLFPDFPPSLVPSPLRWRLFQASPLAVPPSTSIPFVSLNLSPVLINPRLCWRLPLAVESKGR